ncbi:MAG TPA: EamA family transporter [Longimicrobiales bacterium]|nr:EamA family transporter [Longimicrobiales bacterium]
MAEPVTRAKIIAAFAAVYIIWGSTYLGILFAIETLPPFLMAGTRFVVAGALLFAWAWRRREADPTAAQWRTAAIIGGLLLLGGNGAVSWAEQYVPSGIAALLIAVTPLWMVLLDWLWHGARRPDVRIVMGLVLGFTGIALLVGPAEIMGAGSVHLVGALVVLAGSLSWSIGSIHSRRTASPAGGMLGVGMQMLCGGGLLLLLGTVTGEWARLDLAAVSLRSALAVVYLALFGSIVGYTAYMWLLQVVSAARVATYAYVNPVVAVLLGWGLAGEALTMRMGVAAAVIVAGVALITSARTR